MLRVAAPDQNRLTLACKLDSQRGAPGACSQNADLLVGVLADSVWRLLVGLGLARGIGLRE
jgi:hypothetical protein